MRAVEIELAQLTSREWVEAHRVDWLGVRDDFRNWLIREAA